MVRLLSLLTSSMPLVPSGVSVLARLKCNHITYLGLVYYFLAATSDGLSLDYYVFTRYQTSLVPQGRFLAPPQTATGGQGLPALLFIIVLMALVLHALLQLLQKMLDLVDNRAPIPTPVAYPPLVVQQMPEIVQRSGDIRYNSVGLQSSKAIDCTLPHGKHFRLEEGCEPVTIHKPVDEGMVDPTRGTSGDAFDLTPRRFLELRTNMMAPE